jgi:hypothetical protein
MKPLILSLLALAVTVTIPSNAHGYEVIFANHPPDRTSEPFSVKCSTLAKESLYFSQVRFLGNLKDRKRGTKEDEVAVITLQFDPGEIGHDYEVAARLAKIAAAKVAGDGIYYVSGTERNNPREIASVTYRVVNEHVDLDKFLKKLDEERKVREAKDRREAEIREAQDRWEAEVKNVAFGQAWYTNVIDKRADLAKVRTDLGLKKGTIKLRSGRKVEVERDIKTNRILSDEEIEHLVRPYVQQLIEDFKVSHKEMYKRDGDALRAINRRYLKSYPEIDMPKWPTWEKYDTSDAFRYFRPRFK